LIALIFSRSKAISFQTEGQADRRIGVLTEQSVVHQREERGRATCTRKKERPALHMSRSSRTPHGLPRTVLVVLHLYAILSVSCFPIHRFSLIGQAGTLGIICDRSHWENQKRLFTYVEDHHTLCDTCSCLLKPNINGDCSKTAFSKFYTSWDWKRVGSVAMLSFVRNEQPRKKPN